MKLLQLLDRSPAGELELWVARFLQSVPGGPIAARLGEAGPLQPIAGRPGRQRFILIAALVAPQSGGGQGWQPSLLHTPGFPPSRGSCCSGGFGCSCVRMHLLLLRYIHLASEHVGFC